MKRALYGGAVAILLLGGVVVWAAPLSSTPHTLYTLAGFVDTLITRGIIPPALANTARTLVAYMDTAPTPTGAMNADKVVVSTSQLIEHSDLTFNRFEDVAGILLLVRNTTDAPITLEARRKCQVVYRIYDTEDTLVYDSATSERCLTSTEQVTYTLAGGQTRMFEISHEQSTHDLPPGTYRFEVEYPGYGAGERMVTIKG